MKSIFFRRKGDSGFTITELLIVVSLVGILSAIAVPNLLAYLPGYYLNGAARDMITDLSYARMRATAANREYRLRIYTETGSYQVEVGNLSSQSTTWTAEGMVRNFSDSASPHYHKGIDIVSAPNAIRFKPTGIATTATVQLRNSAGNTANIKVSISGRIKKE